MSTSSYNTARTNQEEGSVDEHEGTDNSLDIYLHSSDSMPPVIRLNPSVQLTSPSVERQNQVPAEPQSPAELVNPFAESQSPAELQNPPAESRNHTSGSACSPPVGADAGFGGEGFPPAQGPPFARDASSRFAKGPNGAADPRLTSKGDPDVTKDPSLSPTRGPDVRVDPDLPPARDRDSELFGRGMDNLALPPPAKDGNRKIAGPLVEICKDPKGDIYRDPNGDYRMSIEETGSDPQSLNQGSDLEQHVFTEDQRQRNAAEFSHTTESSEEYQTSSSYRSPDGTVEFFVRVRGVHARHLINVIQRTRLDDRTGDHHLGHGNPTDSTLSGNNSNDTLQTPKSNLNQDQDHLNTRPQRNPPSMTQKSRPSSNVGNFSRQREDHSISSPPRSASSSSADLRDRPNALQAPVRSSPAQPSPRQSQPADQLSRDMRLDDDRVPFQLMNTVALKLNRYRADGKNWRGLADLLKCDKDCIRNIKDNHKGEQTQLVLEHWEIEPEATVGNLCDKLRELGREDVAKLFNLR